jgi:KDO2-lipid IV(A) lauroyltransferase
LRGLRQNRIVYLIADERKKRDGILAPFLGKPALTTPGPAVLSLRTGAPIIPMFVTKREGRKHVIEILPPIDIEKTGNIEKDIYNLTEAANNAISDYIRKYPDQWAWTNPRWKI